MLLKPTLQGHDGGGLVVAQGVPVPDENAVLKARPGLKHQGLKGQEAQNAVRDDNHPVVLLDFSQGLGQKQSVELLSLLQGKPVRLLVDEGFHKGLDLGLQCLPALGNLDQVLDPALP